MNLKIVGHEVLKVEEVTTPNQTATVKTHHDMLYKTILTYDSANQKVRAEVHKFNLSIEQHELDTTYQDVLIFEYETQQIETNAVNGLAEIEFVAEAGTGEHVVKTVNPLWNNGEVVINA